MAGGLGKKLAAQGTVEYLVVIAVVVVLALVVVGILVSQTGSTGNISASASKISQSSGAISVSEAVVGSDGNGLITLLNNSGSTIVLTKINVDGSDTSYSNISLSQGDKKTFSLGNIGSSCSCVGFEGKKKNCNVVVYTASEYGLAKQFTTSVSVECVSVAKATASSAVVQPISYAINLSLKDSFNDANLSGINIDCDGAAYDLTNQSSPLSISFNPGTYSCVFSKTGYSSVTRSVVAGSSQSLSIYMSPSSSVHFSDCNTLSTTDGNYVLDNNIGSGGTCLTITADNVKIYGNGFKITGKINASKSGDRAYTGLRINNLIVDGNVQASAETGYKNGGSVNIVNSTIRTIDTSGHGGWNTGTGGAGGSVTITDSNITTIITMGGSGCYGGTSGAVIISNSTVLEINTIGGEGSYAGAVGGAVTITNSNITTVTASGGASYYIMGAAGGVVIVSDSNITTIDTSGKAGINGPNGGAGGAVTISNSTITTINTTGASRYYAGAVGGAVTITNSTITTITTTGGTGGTVNGTYVGGAGGAVAITNSAITTITTIGGAGATGKAGGAGGNVTFNVCPTPVPSVTVTGGSGTPAGADGTISPSNCHNP